MNAIATIQGVRGYIDADGTAHLNVEDVARGLGFTQIAASGNEVVRWERVNRYLNDFGFIPTSGDGVKADDYIPENIFYRLAMKAKNAVAEKFQALVADEILPTIRKTGYYSTAAVNPNLPLATMMTDIGETSAVMEKFFGVKHGIALAKSIAVAEVKYSMDLATLKELLPPAEHNIGLLNATQVGEKLGKGAQATNKLLCEHGFQIKDGRNYTLTEKGEQFGECLPYDKNGHSGYRILWSYAIVDELRRLSENKMTLVK